TPFQSHAPLEAGSADVVAADPEHLFGQVNRPYLGTCIATTQLDGDLRGARPDIEDAVLAVPDCEEVRDKDAVDRGMVHGVVVIGLLGRVHDLGFENASQHGSLPR